MPEDPNDEPPVTPDTEGLDQAEAGTLDQPRESDEGGDGPQDPIPDA